MICEISQNVLLCKILFLKTINRETETVVTKKSCRKQNSERLFE
jgi:hypothetical protein